MKLIKKHLSTFTTSLCSALLSLLGYSCSSSPDDPGYICMYGMPTGDFEIKGSVTTEEGNAVDDAEIRVTHPEAPSGVYSLQTTTTNADGQYLAEGESYAASELKVVCIPSNLELEPDSVIVKMHSNKDNTGAWDAGYAKETVDFKLKSKSPEEK